MSIPLQTIKQHRIIPLSENEKTLTIGALATPPPGLLRDLSFVLGKRIEVIDVTENEWEAAAAKLGHEDQPVEVSYSQPRAQSSPRGSVTEVVNQLIAEAIECGASDIHVEPYEKRLRVRYRLDGVLIERPAPPHAQKNALTSRLKIMASLDIAEKRRPQDGRIRFEHQGKTVDLRVSTLPTDFGEKVVLRLLDKSGVALDLQAIGLSKNEHKAIERALRLPYGMILVTGPTGSGKTTTLYAALSDLNNEEVNITTVEDPIEYNLEGINQTHVRSDIGLTFAAALRSFLRQDPDIIMVGEMRDRETVEIAIRAALTGHLVLSTIHTNDAPSTLVRLGDMGIEPFMISASLRLVIAQRLLRRICTTCKREAPLDKAALLEMGIADIPDKLFEGSGCAACNGTGYRGRMAIFEVLVVTESLAELIANRAPLQVIRNKALDEGLVTLRESALRHMNAGRTTLSEVLRETATI